MAKKHTKQKSLTFTKPSRKNISRDIYIRVGENIRVLREDAGMTVKELAYTAGISPSFMANIENARRKPTLYTIERLARALNAATNDVIGKEVSCLELNEDIVTLGNTGINRKEYDMESLFELIKILKT